MPTSRVVALKGILSLALAFASVTAHAEQWDLCPPQRPLPEPRLQSSGDPAATDAVADEITSAGATHVLTGNVELMKGEQRVGADRIEIDRAGGIAEAEGNVYLRSNEMAVLSPGGRIDMDTGAFDMAAPQLLYPKLHGQGGADRGVRDDAGVATLTGATWSTCPEEDEDWVLRAETLRLNPNNRQGTAHHASLWFQGAPLLYTPWFRFPLGDARLTGFLPPSIGQSSDNGTTVTVPWYWNIAPNFDMTITPRSLWKRESVQLNTETRWLGAAGSWTMDLNYLPDDQEFGDDRYFGRLRQQGRFGRGVRTDVDVAGISDNDYFEDSLGQAGSVVGNDNLERRADLFWNHGLGRSQLRLQSFRTLDETIPPSGRPYKQLPQVTHRYNSLGRGLGFGFDGELVAFERDESDTATRVRMVPAVSWPLQTPGWFLRPRLAIDHTSYDIERETSVGPDRIDRTLPVFSLDSGLVFERFGERFYQTLEPRAFFVYIPEEEQDDIPIFDTSSLTFNFNRLFEERRFSGGDRIGDTHRLSLALTSRLLDDSGSEFLRGSIGAIHHFKDREVTLPGGQAETTDLSDLVGEIAVRPNDRWRGNVTAQWDPEEEVTRRQDTRLTYRGPGGGIANLDYRYKSESQRQTDLSLVWPVSPRWTLLARNAFDDIEDRHIETLLGVEYESCCWRLRAVAKESIEQDESDPDGVNLDQSIMIELVLKGLGGLGDPAGESFEDAILGYDDPSD